MKVERLTESKEVVLEQHLTENVDQVREWVRQELEDILDHAFDNVANHMVEFFDDYNSEWCQVEAYGPNHERLMKTRLAFLNAVEAMLFANAPQNEALTEALGVANLQMFLDGIEFEHIGSGEVVIKCKTEDDYKKAQRVLFKQRIPVEAEDGLHIYVDDKYIYPANECLSEAVDMSTMKYAVIKPNGEYAGVPCESVDEARELAAQEEGRVVFKLSKVLFGESYDEDGNPEKCEKCGTLLNDMGTCPKCDDGEEDYGDNDLDEAVENDKLPAEARAIIEDAVIGAFDSGHADEELWDYILEDLEGIVYDEAAAKLYFHMLLNAGPEGISSLNESVLNEGPGLRSLGRKIANKFDPKNATEREIKGHVKDAKAHKAKKAPAILAQDFATKSMSYKFYPNVPNPKAMDYDEWMIAYSDAKEGSDKYAQWYNAIVTDANGYMIRRGSENLKGKLEKYVPGKNDKILGMYRTAPYTYYGKETVKPEPTPTTPAPEEEPRKPETDEKPPRSGGTRTRKPPVPLADKDLSRFVQLCRLTSLRVFANSNTETQLTTDQLKAITTDTLDQYSVSAKYQKKLVSLADWMQTAKKMKFLEKFDRQLRGSLNESLLMEAPRISFDDADLMNPDSVDFKSLIKKAQDKEDAEAAAKADAEKVAALKDKAEQVLSDIASFDSWEDQLDAVHSIIVPNEGKADSLGGELVRAIVRIIYRDRNDGDKFFQGYGLETCGSSAMFLYNNGFDMQIDHIIENAGRYEDNDDEYSDAINKLGQLVIDRIQNEPELLTTLNNVDSRTLDYTYIEEQQPTYDFEFYGSDDIVELVDAEILNSWKLKEYVEQQLEWNSACRGCEIERPWTHYDHSVQVTGLTRDGLDYIEQELFNDPDSFWQDLVDEYSDELEELRNGYDDDDDPEDDIDESIVMESASNYYFQHGDEVLGGMNGNLSDKELDYQIKYLSRIARKLGLKRVEDLVLFCDDEWVYDPTMFDNRFFTLPEQPNEFNVNGVTFIAAKEFNQIWLYFRNEDDGVAYLGYCDARA